MPIHKNPLKIARSAELKHRFQRINAFLILIIKTDNPTFIRNFGILFLVPYTKDFGRITQF